MSGIRESSKNLYMKATVGEERKDQEDADDHDDHKKTGAWLWMGGLYCLTFFQE